MWKINYKKSIFFKSIFKEKFRANDVYESMVQKRWISSCYDIVCIDNDSGFLSDFEE